MKNLRIFLITTLIGGFLVVLPLAIFVVIVRLLVQFIVSLISPLTSLINLEISAFWINTIVLAGIIVFCFLLGLFIRTQLGKTSFRFIEENWLERLPAYSTIRDIVQQFTGARKAPFHKVVLIDAFNSGATMLGFVTDEDDINCAVFVPTAPNPTNGFVFIVPKDQVTRLNAKAEEAIRAVVGLGVGSLEILNRQTRDPGDMSAGKQSPHLDTEPTE